MPALPVHPAFHELLHRHLYTRVDLGSDESFNASAILKHGEQRQLQVIATSFSSISILAALCAIYWFCTMRRNFRRDLVLLLIFGDLWKSFWFLVFSTKNLAGGHVETASHFCQASGYLLQVGLIACDYAILLMSIHMSLQIFPPKQSFLGHDGLYRIRYYVLATWIIFPCAISSLAFINSGPAFIAQGGFCTLPIRPFWYRLALSWIPRYLIWLTVMGVAIRIYRHVGYEFKVFGEEKDQSSSMGVLTGSASAARISAARQSVAMHFSATTHSDEAATEKQPIDDIAPDDNGETRPGIGGRNSSKSPRTRRFSVPTWKAPPTTDHRDPALNAPLPSPTSKSLPTSRRGSRQVDAGVGFEDFAHPPMPEVSHTCGTIAMTPVRSSPGSAAYNPSQPVLEPITEHKASAATTLPQNAASRALQKRRRAIQRQLRLLFIYPVAYLILWIMPFVAHALNYSNYFAQHPVFAISLLNVFCQNIMGFCDVCIFCWREKPWRHIPGSDGTLSGSFLFWRYIYTPQWADKRRKSTFIPPAGQEDQGEERQREKSTPDVSGLLTNIKRWSLTIPRKDSSFSAQPSQGSLASPTTPTRRSAPQYRHRYTSSGGSDRRVMEAERAHERLVLERAEYQNNRMSLQDRQASVISSLAHSQHGHIPASPGIERKEWWDRQMSIGGESLLHVGDDDDEKNAPTARDNKIDG